MTNLGWFRGAAAALLAVAGLGLLPAQADDISRSGATVAVNAAGETVSVAGAVVGVAGNARRINAAGANVAIKGTVSETVRAAGADVAIDATVNGDVSVVGATINLRGTVGGGLWAGGASIDADLPVKGDLKAAAGRVILGPATAVGGDLYAGGGEVSVAGRVNGETKLSGGRVSFDARTDGSLTIEADEATIGPNAVVGGDLVLVGDTQPVIDPAAKIAGQTRKAQPESWWKGPKVDPRPGRLGFSLFIAGTAILAGLGMLLLGRRSFDEAANLVRARPGIDFVVGLVVLVLLPIVAVILFFTAIGIPIGIGLLLLLPLLLIIGHATVALGIADWAFNRTGEPRTVGRSILFLVVGAIAIAIAGAIPFIGPLIVFIVLLVGLGAFLVMLRHRLNLFAEV